MKCKDINIRDPFVLSENGKYYMYGTRAKNFGVNVGGVDVYVSSDLETWSEPVEVFDSAAFGLNGGVNWAPEVHKYNGGYYMFITFTQKNGLRGTYVLKADSPEGPFTPHSDGAVTPDGWECLDGTLYVEDGTPYLVFCHEHTQITDGTVCFIELSADLTRSVGEPVTLFCGSSPYYIEEAPPDGHYVTDGPFMFKTENGTLLMLWSTFIHSRYAECLVRFEGGSIKNPFGHLAPLIDDDGGHGMLFKAGDKLFLTFHTPNRTDYERPRFVEVCDKGNTLEIK
ncbi:MAG: glycoside hydrolase family 43 protein [Eubacterium sp.]|nr:glycoside hydrolase family 43 protein [Eubacterium sp.]